MKRSKTNSNFNSWIFKSFQVSVEGLGLYRIFCGFFLLFFLLPSMNIYPFISSLPDEFFLSPPGLMSLFQGFPPYWVFIFLQSLLVLFLIFMILGWKTKITSITSGLLLLVLKGFIYSVGKINHDFLIIAVPILMAFSGWGRAYSVDAYKGKKAKKIEGWTLTLLALIIGFMFFTAGFSKIIGGWLHLESHATLSNFFKQYFVRDRQDLLAGYAIKITSPYIWEILDYVTVLFEVGFLFAIFRSGLIRIYICFAVLFHFSIMMVLNISFLPNFLAYAAFLDWKWINDRMAEFLKPKNQKEPPPWLVPGVFLFLMILFCSSIKWLSPFLELNSDLLPKEVIVLYCAFIIAIGFLGKQFFDVLKRGRTQ